MINLIKQLYYIFLNIFLKLKFKRKKILFHFGSKIDKRCQFEGYNAIGEKTILQNCSLGRGTYIGRKNELNSIDFGRFCSIGSFITNSAGNHPTNVFVSTHPSFFSKGKAAGFTFSDETIFKELKYVRDNYLVVIGNDVWIGDHVNILDGVTIGDGAIIGSNSLVVNDIEPFTINVGIPAKPINKRFTEDQINDLSKLRWWDKEMDWIKRNYKEFRDIEKFLLKRNFHR